MKEIDWTRFKVVKNDEKQYIKSKTRYIEFCEKLETVNGKILTDYTGIARSITVDIDGVIISKQAMYIINDIDRLINFRHETRLNNDNYCGIIQSSSDKHGYLVKVRTFDNEFVNITTWGYKKFLKGRKTFYDTCKTNNVTVLSGYKGNEDLIKVKFNKCGHIDYITPHLFNSCPKCSICGKSVSTYGEILNNFENIDLYFVDTKDLIGELKTSTKVVKCKCKRCGSYIGERQIKTVMDKDGLLCPTCSDKISSPNKIMFEILSELDVEFEPEKIFDWCEFYNPYTHDISTGRYDFVIESKKLIVEMDGGQHYKETGLVTYSLEELMFRDHEKENLAIKNGYRIIRINCNFDCYDYERIINEIKNSELVLYYPKINNIENSLIIMNAMKNIHDKICGLWNGGYNVDMIHNELHRHKSFIVKSLELSAELGLCNYSKYESYVRRISKPCAILYDDNLICVGSTPANSFRLLNKIVDINCVKGTFFERIRKYGNYYGYKVMYIPSDIYIKYIKTSFCSQVILDYLNDNLYNLQQVD